jgi:hypothetical protein
MGYESYLRKSQQVLQTDRKISSFATLISSLSLVYLNWKVVDVFSFHLQIFHWFIAPPARKYFQGHNPRENQKPLHVLAVSLSK